jgi:universal stress protein E
VKGQTANKVSPDVRPDMLGTHGVEVGKKRMLCATDLSPRSERAVQRAALLASRFDAQLILLHVMAPDQLAERAVHVRDEIAKQLLSNRLPAVREPTIEVRAGDYVQTIAAVAKEIDVDLIILGSKPHRPLAPLIGATAERITRLARRPALIVNLEPRVRYDAVVIAADVSDAFIRVTRLAASLRLLEERSVTIVHGFESPYRGPLYAEGFDLHAAKRNTDEWERAARERLLLRLDSAGVERSRFRLVFQQTRPPRAIQRVIRRLQPELLIVGTKERAALNRVVRGSVANDVLRGLECDILVAAPDAEEASLCTERRGGAVRVDHRKQEIR